jgi:hypothetical protein
LGHCRGGQRRNANGLVKATPGNALSPGPAAGFFREHPDASGCQTERREKEEHGLKKKPTNRKELNKYQFRIFLFTFYIS